MSNEAMDNETIEPEIVEPKTAREWIAIRGECVSGGELNDKCNLVATLHGGELAVIRKVLSCGCILVPEDIEEEELFI